MDDFEDEEPLETQFIIPGPAYDGAVGPAVFAAPAVAAPAMVFDTEEPDPRLLTLTQIFDDLTFADSHDPGQPPGVTTTWRFDALKMN